MKCECKPRMRHRLEVQSATEVQDTYGAAVKTWSTIKSVWGDITPLSGREAIVAMQTEASVTHRIRLRYDSIITPKMRLKMGDRVFNLLPPLNTDERRVEMIALAEEVL